MGLNEFFEGHPARPDTPDFWRLSEIILQLDGAMESAANDDERDQVWKRFVEEKIHGDSLYYLAFQRALRALGLSYAQQARANYDVLIKMTVLYSEAFAVGVAFTEHGGKQ